MGGFFFCFGGGREGRRDLLLGHSAKVQPLEEDDGGGAPAGREGDFARRTLQQDVLAQLRELAVDEQGLAAVLDDDGVDAVVVAQVGLGAGARDGDGLRCGVVRVRVGVAARIEHAQRSAALAGEGVVVIPLAAAVAVVEPEVPQIVRARQKLVQRVGRAEVDVEIHEEGAERRVLLSDVRAVGVVDADIVGQ